MKNIDYFKFHKAVQPSTKEVINEIFQKILIENNNIISADGEIFGITPVSYAIDSGIYKFVGNDIIPDTNSEIYINQFPIPPIINNNVVLTLDIINELNELKNIVSKDIRRIALTGICFKLKDNEIELVATNGYRLIKRTKQTQIISEEQSFVIPIKLIKLLLNYYTTKLVTFSFSDKYITIDAGNIKIIGKLIDEGFPNYDNVIPNTFQHKCSFERKKFINILKNAKQYTNQTTKDIYIKFFNNYGILCAEDLEREISIEHNIQNYVYENHTESIISIDTKNIIILMPIKKEQEEDSTILFKIGFNVEYLLDILSNKCGGIYVDLLWNNTETAFAIQDSVTKKGNLLDFME